jgi:cellobiose phosphorylase
LAAGRLHFEPCLPADWQGFALQYRYRETTYRIAVRQDAEAATSVSVDGVVQREPAIMLVDDRREHQVDVNLKRRPSRISTPAA